MKKLITASIIIPSWNGKHLLKVCLDSLKNQSQTNFEIILVDNGSTDGSVIFVEKNYPKVRLIKLAKNTGFAHAVNQGIKLSEGKYIILINNDTQVEKDCLKYLIKAAENNPQISFIAAKMLNFYDRKMIDSVGDFIDNVGHANNLGMGEPDDGSYDQQQKIFLATGGGSLFKRELFKKVGLFDEDYFAYMEDVDLCLRAQMQGFQGILEPKAKIYHIHKATSATVKPFSEYLQFRNMTMTIIKDFPSKLIFKNWNWLLIILVNINTVRFLAMKGLFVSAIKAELWILWNLPKLLSKRSAIQSAKKVSDDYLISNFHQKKITFFGLFRFNNNQNNQH